MSKAPRSQLRHHSKPSSFQYPVRGLCGLKLGLGFQPPGAKPSAEVMLGPRQSRLQLLCSPFCFSSKYLLVPGKDPRPPMWKQRSLSELHFLTLEFQQSLAGSEKTQRKCHRLCPGVPTWWGRQRYKRLKCDLPVPGVHYGPNEAKPFTSLSSFNPQSVCEVVPIASSSISQMRTLRLREVNFC